MAIVKPVKPGVNLPDNFGGIKTPYSAEQIRDGYKDGIPQIVDGGNINFEKDGTFKNIKYLRTVADAITDMPIGKVLTVDSNNRLDYQDRIDSTVQLKANISQTIDTSTTKYPSNNAVQDAISKIDVSGKQDKLNQNQLNAVNSGITSTKVSTYDGLQGQINGKANTDLSNVIWNSAVNTSSGYLYLPNGLLMQWGRYDNGKLQSNIQATVTFAKPYKSSSSYSLSASTFRGDNNHNDGYVCIGSYSSTSFTFLTRITDISGGSRYIKWFAIGQGA